MKHAQSRITLVATILDGLVGSIPTASHDAVGSDLLGIA
jgi:hypothetical protein